MHTHEPNRRDDESVVTIIESTERSGVPSRPVVTNVSTVCEPLSDDTRFSIEGGRNRRCSGSNPVEYGLAHEMIS